MASIEPGRLDRGGAVRRLLHRAHHRDLLQRALAIALWSSAMFIFEAATCPITQPTRRRDGTDALSLELDPGSARSPPSTRSPSPRPSPAFKPSTSTNTLAEVLEQLARRLGSGPLSTGFRVGTR